MKSENILVNASGAKCGGAITVLERYCKEVSSRVDSRKYYVLSPFEPKVKAKNIVWIKKETNGLATFLFAILFAMFYALKFDCRRIISFSNINVISARFFRTTYFHNYLIFNSNNLQYVVLRGYLLWFNQRSVDYIFQTDFVRERFENKFYGIRNSKVCWPGILPPNDIPSHSFRPSQVKRSSVLVPITDVSNVHKNFCLVKSIARQAPHLDFLVTASAPIDCDSDSYDNVKYIGTLEQDRFYETISSCKVMLITSSVETVGLPLFESLYCNVPVLVFERRYLKQLLSSFSYISGVYLFLSAGDACLSLDNIDNMKVDSVDPSVFIGNWSF